MDWTEKYRPRTLKDVRGNNKSVKELKQWADTWNEHREPALIIGEPGVGKTSAVHALANDKNWEVTELNASDSRTKDAIESIAGEASMSQSLTGNKKLIVLDEADNLHGNADRGGSRAVTEVLKNTNQPIVLIGNDEYEISRSLRNKCREVKFRNVGKRSIKPVLRDILDAEGIEYDTGALEVIADRNSGDLRGAINDLQAQATGKTRLTIDDVNATSNRDSSLGIFELLDMVFKGHNAADVIRESWDVDESPEDMIHWVEDNVEKAYNGNEVTDAYRYLSRSDVYLGRTRDTQNYSLWKYASDLMLGGVQVAKKEKKSGWISYSPPSKWRRLGQARKKRETRDSIARKIAESSLTSMATAREEYLDALELMLDTKHAPSIARSLDLTPEEAAYLLDIDETEAEELIQAEPMVEKEVIEEKEEEDAGQSSLSNF